MYQCIFDNATRDRSGHHGITEIFRTDGVCLGWVAITGCSGYGSGTLGQYLSHMWSLGGAPDEGLNPLSPEGRELIECLNTDFDFVYRIQCRVMVREGIWEHVVEQTPLGYVCELIIVTLGPQSEVSRIDIMKSLVNHSERTLIILDGFDDICRTIYGVVPEATAAIDKVMRFKNGVITAKKYYLSESWLRQNSQLNIRCFELLGFTQDNIRGYISDHFAATTNQGMSDFVLDELIANEGMCISTTVILYFDSSPFFCRINEYVYGARELFGTLCDLGPRGYRLDVLFYSRPWRS